MTDVIPQWQAYFASGRSLSLAADRSIVAAKLRSNRTGIVVSAVLAVLVLAGFVVLLATDGGRLSTYLVVGLLVVALLVVVARLASLRRRLRAYASAADPLVTVSAGSVTFSGVPPIAWGDVLGVVASDLASEYAAARGLGGWLRRTALRTGGSAIAVAIGIERAGAYKAGATGGLSHDLLAVTDDNGQAGIFLDHALPIEQARQVVTALKVAAWLNGVGFIASNQAREGADAAARMLKGERLEPRA